MVNATAKYVRIAPRKAGEMADLIRGKKVSEAKAILALHHIAYWIKNATKMKVVLADYA